MIKLEANKYYRTRDGQKAYCAHIGVPDDMNSKDYQAFCVIKLTHIGSYKTELWTTNGQFSGKQEHNNDLVEEWRDPVFKYFPIFQKGPGTAFDTQEQAYDSAGASATVDNPFLQLAKINETTKEITLIKRTGTED